MQLWALGLFCYNYNQTLDYDLQKHFWLHCFTYLEFAYDHVTNKKQFGTEHLYFVIIHFKFEISVLDQLHMRNCPPDCSTDTIDYIYYNL